jgi:MFS family permease
MSPIAGALVDRWDRRWAMILSDLGCTVCVLVAALLLSADALVLWEVCALLFVNGVFSSFQWPAYSAATTMLVPQERLAKASGLVQMAEAGQILLSPAIAGLLLFYYKAQGALLVDFCTFVLSIIVLLGVRIPRPESSAESKEARGSLLTEAAFGWRYIK